MPRADHYPPDIMDRYAECNPVRSRDKFITGRNRDQKIIRSACIIFINKVS